MGVGMTYIISNVVFTIREIDALCHHWFDASNP
jgi:hypothetical protein